MTPYLKVTDEEARCLAWIPFQQVHCPRAFLEEVLFGKSFQYACRVLKNYSSPERGLLQRPKSPPPHRFLNSYYFLTAGANPGLGRHEPNPGQKHPLSGQDQPLRKGA